MKRILTGLAMLALLLSTACGHRTPAGPEVIVSTGNTKVASFEEAKRHLYKVYRTDSERKTVYCGFPFDSGKKVTLPAGFPADKYASRATVTEAEHVVPAENFGRAFREWTQGAPACVDASGKPYTGRKCAEKASKEFRLMESDLHNLWPAVGSVNAARSNYTFTDMGISDSKATFGPTCPMAIEDRKAQPPKRARGIIARDHLYFESVYPTYRMSDQQRKLMEAWDRMYPPTKFECERNRRIAEIQGNSNPFIDRACR